MSYLIGKWNRPGKVIWIRRASPDHCLVLHRPFPERRTATPEAARLGSSGGKGLCATVGGKLDEWFNTRALIRVAQAQGALARILRGLRLPARSSRW